MIGKSMTHLFRLAMTIRALEYACITIEGFDDSAADEITDIFAEKCRIAAENVPNEAFIIDLETANVAKRLVDYFNMNKLLLSSYQIDSYSSFDVAFQKIVDNRPIINVPAIRFAQIPPVILRYMKRAFEINVNKFNVHTLSSNNLNLKQAKQVFDQLVSLNLGSIKRVSCQL